jgi:hypothetical protein
MSAMIMISQNKGQKKEDKKTGNEQWRTITNVFESRQ